MDAVRSPGERRAVVGPGLAIAELTRRATRGMVYGIDHSDVMLKQATKHNTAAIRAQRVKLPTAISPVLPVEAR
jgi:trans-aconitate methyltransferase